MTEMLIAIILACQVIGGEGNSYNTVEQIQKGCRKKLIKCVNEKKSGTNWTGVGLKECLESQ